MAPQMELRVPPLFSFTHKDLHMAWVYIENGIVKDRVQVPPHDIFYPAYADMFVEAPDEVDFYWTFDGEEFSAPPPPEPAPAPPPPTKEDLLAQLQALQAQIESLGD
jgi:hypothetical protein